MEGAFFNTGTSAVVDSTFSANEANDGGGLFNEGTLALTNQRDYGQCGI